MYIVLYSFKVKPNHTEQFIKAWKDLTLLIKTHEKSLGSRLHKQETLHYIAYAQWPNKNHYDNAGNHLPSSADAVQKAMRESCEKIEVLNKLEVVEDLLVKQ